MFHLPAALQGVSANTVMENFADLFRLYCSSECRMQDKGTPSPAVYPVQAPLHLTAQLPIRLSPRIRPTYSVGPSPRMPPHVPSYNHAGDSSSSSSITSSPFQSPRTNPSASDSPKKEAFDLPPPAFTSNQIYAFPGSVPVKIPALITRPNAKTMASLGTTLYPNANSVDTLRFGRKPGVINSVTSPNALLPRCACGKPSDHQGRPPNKDAAALDPDLTHLSLGPSKDVPHGDLKGRSARVVSDSILPPFDERFQTTHSGSTTYLKPSRNAGNILGGSHLSRSRSDPISPSSKIHPGSIVPLTTYEKSTIASNRRGSTIECNDERYSPQIPMKATVVASFKARYPPPTALANLLGPPSTIPPDRGRSRDRLTHAATRSGNTSGILHQPGEREKAPSRSRISPDERRRSAEKCHTDRDRAREGVGKSNQGERWPIKPSWSRPTSMSEALPAGKGMAPPSRRQGSEGREDKNEKIRGNVVGVEEGRGRTAADLKQASKQLGQIFGVAAG